MNTISPKSRLVAALLAGFIGGFGAHRFYVGKNGTAIAQLLLSLSIVGIFASATWALIDLVIILAGAFKDKDGAKVEDWKA